MVKAINDQVEYVLESTTMQYMLVAVRPHIRDRVWFRVWNNVAEKVDSIGIATPLLLDLDLESVIIGDRNA